jgi:hypothetical protein
MSSLLAGFRLNSPKEIPVEKSSWRVTECRRPASETSGSRLASLSQLRHRSKLDHPTVPSLTPRGETTIQKCPAISGSKQDLALRPSLNGIIVELWARALAVREPVNARFCKGGSQKRLAITLSLWLSTSGRPSAVTNCVASSRSLSLAADIARASRS